jgi:hypothetical protein
MLGGLPLVRAARVVVAVERYRRAHGEAFPDDVSALVPAYLSAVPTDPYSGEGIRFAPADDGYAVYSVGPDREDNGGDLDQRPLPPPGTSAPDQGFRIRYR